MVFLTAASLPHACGTLPSGCAAISLVIWINRFVSRLSPKSALPNSSCAQLSALVILLVLRRPYLPLPYFSLILLFFTLPLLLSMSIVLLIIYHRTSGLVGNDKIPAPGVKSEDVEITVQQETVSLKWETKMQAPEGATVHWNCLQSGRFQQSFSLPSPINAERVEAQYADGILTLHLPKAEHAKART